MKKMLAVIFIILFGTVVLAYGLSVNDVETQTQAKYSAKLMNFYTIWRMS